MMPGSIPASPPRSTRVGSGAYTIPAFKHFIAEKAGCSPQEVQALTLGSHGDTMVPVPSQVRVQGKPLAEVFDAETIDALVARTRDGGAEIVGLATSSTPPD